MDRLPVSDSDPFAYALADCVTDAIARAHLDAATDALPDPCPVCHGIPCAAAYFHADVLPYVSPLRVATE